MHAAKQVLWQHSLFRKLKIELPTTSTIFSDNQATIAIAHHPEFHVRTKHINISYHFLRDLVKSGTLNLVYVNTHQNLTDLFTKGLPRVTHQDLTYEIGVLPSARGLLHSPMPSAQNSGFKACQGLCPQTPGCILTLMLAALYSNINLGCAKS
jgi:hypothetical protein